MFLSLLQVLRLSSSTDCLEELLGFLNGEMLRDPPEMLRPPPEILIPGGNTGVLDCNSVAKLYRCIMYIFVSFTFLSPIVVQCPPVNRQISFGLNLFSLARSGSGFSQIRFRIQSIRFGFTKLLLTTTRTLKKRTLHVITLFYLSHKLHIFTTIWKPLHSEFWAWSAKQNYIIFRIYNCDIFLVSCSVLMINKLHNTLQYLGGTWTWTAARYTDSRRQVR